MFKKIAFFVLLIGFIQPVYCFQEECEEEPDERAFTSSFDTGDCWFRTRYFWFEEPHAYWIMEPGWQVVLEGEDDGEMVRLVITVLNEVEWVNGVRTRVIEEREWIDDELYEVSRNFFAICNKTNDIFYFGEDVDFYEDGEVVNHDGSWRAGEDGAEAGIIFPGTVLAGSRFYQEVAPDIAEDRAEILEITDMEVQGEVLEGVVVIKESTALEGPCEYSIKHFAPGIGMIKDDDLELVDAGYAFTTAPHAPKNN